MNQTNTTASTSSTTLADVERAVEAMKRLVGDDPLAEYMRSLGMPPETHLCVLPNTPAYRELLGPFPPRYVRFSSICTSPTIVMNLELSR